MRRLYLILGVAVAVNGGSIPVTEDPAQYVTNGMTVTWRYEDQTVAGYNEPSMWAGVCTTGNKQSPIDVKSADLRKASYDVGKVTNHLYEMDIIGDLYNTDRHITYQVTQNLKPYISGGPLDSKYVFNHMDFHFGQTSSEGSEHTINGKQYPMEISLVFYNGKYSDIEEAGADTTVKDALATVSYMVEVSSTDNDALKNIIDNLNIVQQPTTPTSHSGYVPLHKTDYENVENDVTLNLEDIFGLDVTDFYYYDGSLTSPTSPSNDCSENVRHILSNKRLKISEAQLDTFRTLQAHDSDYLYGNFRAVQTGDRIKDIKSDGVYWRKSKFEIDSDAAQILGASLVGAGVFHQVYTLLQQPETAKALRENPLVDLISSLPIIGDQEVVQQRSSEEKEVQQYQQPVYQPQQYQQYVPQPAQTA